MTRMILMTTMTVSVMMRMPSPIMLSTRWILTLMECQMHGKLKYGLDPNDASDATSDQDNDGVTALDEFLAGTIPSGS